VSKAQASDRLGVPFTKAYLLLQASVMVRLRSCTKRPLPGNRYRNRLLPVVPLPRYPCPVQHLADTMNCDADSEYILVLALSMAGRSAAEVVDAGRLQTWLGMSAAGDGATVILR
jgi:hypothetical protein